MAPAHWINAAVPVLREVDAVIAILEEMSVYVSVCVYIFSPPVPGPF